MLRVAVSVPEMSSEVVLGFVPRCERFPPVAVLRVGAAMEVERDSEEGAFVTEDVSAIIKEVRLPGHPTGPRQRSQGVP